MHYCDVVELFDETGLSPENLAPWLSLSASTYRRWLKTPPHEVFPDEYRPNVATGVYKLLENKALSYDSLHVAKFMERHVPEFFQAAIGRLKSTEDLFSGNATHQDKITAVLANLGNSSGVRKKVDRSAKNILKFTAWGAAWKYRVKLLMSVITSKEITLVDRLVAYGALFYLILPFDLVPDSIPVFGYVDDFGILGFAVMHYTKRSAKTADGNPLSITDAG